MARDRILDALARIEADQKVRILFAAESGSRAWGFESADSDFDVRFVYVRRPQDYLTIYKRRDVIEPKTGDNDLDISGWDLPKALGLLAQGNTTAGEWFRSPTIYQTDQHTDALRAYASTCFSVSAARWHYFGLCKSTKQKYFDHKQTVRLKKYFYVIRPALCLLWLRHKETEPPMEIGKLMDLPGVPDTVRQKVEELRSAKQKASESATTSRIETLDEFVADQTRWHLDNPPHKDVSRWHLVKDGEVLFRQIAMAQDVLA